MWTNKLPCARVQELEQHQVKEVLSCEWPPPAPCSGPPHTCARGRKCCRLLSKRPLTTAHCSVMHCTCEQISQCAVVGAGLLHTIVFCRALGPVRPQEVDLQLFDITYVRFFVPF